MIYVGIDDTDTLDTRGTNQLARAMAQKIRPKYACVRITRHQLLDDPRVPYTSKNGSASLVLAAIGDDDVPWLQNELVEAMRADFIPGSDPGLCIAAEVTVAVRQFGRHCQTAFVAQEEARTLAQAEGITLLGLGGSEDGVIGALAAVGLAAEGNDGRIIQLGDWPDDLSGVQPLAALSQRGVTVRDIDTNHLVDCGLVHVGKKLRPNWRNGACVLFVRPTCAETDDAHSFEAIKLV